MGVHRVCEWCDGLKKMLQWPWPRWVTCPVCRGSGIQLLDHGGQPIRRVPEPRPVLPTPCRCCGAQGPCWTGCPMGQQQR